VPWFPDFVSAVELARSRARSLGLADPVQQYFNALETGRTHPIPASSGEGANQPLRHRLSRGGNRKLNAAIHRMDMIQIRYEPRARTLVDNAMARGHTRREAMRILKRHLAAVIYRTMLKDARDATALT
jgi:transposase